MNQYPRDLNEARALAKYWVIDIGKTSSWILQQAKNGMNFRYIDGGWSTHCTSDLAIPPKIEKPPKRIYGQSLLNVILLSFVYDNKPLSYFCMMPLVHEVDYALKELAEQMLCPSATFASCLRNLMHPGLSEALLEFSYDCALKYGYNFTEKTFQKYLKAPLKVFSHQDYCDVIEVIKKTDIRFIQTSLTGHVELPCGVFLSCHPTDHVLLFVWLLKKKSLLVSDMQKELSASTEGIEELYGVITSIQSEIKET